ncbi:transcription factor bHLH130-like isoform X2 [Nymphaea colorata]|uniref:transcription factor bHLH130-like isoform X2 n=1 Tax=Nymphaea colorata TaxID=210225 RepID=UPI00214EB636|nr:transcription factor bHLH130-like isoform X2 [Nymphaea colorata]
MDFLDPGASATGLTRYRSATSALLAGHLAEAVGEEISTATENTFAKLIPDRDPTCLTSELIDFRPTVFGNKEVSSQHQQDGHPATTCSSSMLYRTLSGNRGDVPATCGEGLSCLGVNTAVRSNGGVLLRHSSSPAGFFSHLTVDNGYSVMSNVGSFSSGNASNGETASASAAAAASRLKQQLSFQRHASSTRRMPRIPEMSCDTDETAGISGNTRLVDGSEDRCGYLSGFPIGLFDDSRISPEKIMSDSTASHTQVGSVSGHFPPPLSHQFSLPRTSAEMAALEQYFLEQDSPQFKVRAKRGCATHPRSIAERVRRTRISQRMRKLQELVPNMEKQTNTADMLELAVDYIKELRQKIQALSRSRSTCTCGSAQNTY